MEERKYNNILILQVVTLIVVVILLVDRLSLQKQGSVINSSAPESKAVPAQLNTLHVDWSNNYVWGRPEAQNFMIIYSNYNCDLCSSFYQSVFDSLHSSHVIPGRLKIISKYLVNPKDTIGHLKARLAEVARQTNHYEEVHEKFIENGQLTDSISLVNIVLATGVPEDEVKHRLNSLETIERIEADNHSASQLNIPGTPSFVINGKVYVGFKTYKDLLLLL